LDTFKVVWPLGKWSGTIVPLAKRVTTLEGKTIRMPDSGAAFTTLQQLLKEKYTGIKFIPTNSKDKHDAFITGIGF
jgi:hypothetical protein